MNFTQVISRSISAATRSRSIPRKPRPNRRAVPRRVEVEAEAEDEAAEVDESEDEDEAETEAEPAVSAESDDDRSRRRRRGRRGGRRRRENGDDARAGAVEREESRQHSNTRLPPLRAKSAAGATANAAVGAAAASAACTRWMAANGSISSASDLKHLSPRPERGARNRCGAADAEDEPETEEAPSADIIVHPSAEPVLEPAMAAEIQPVAAAAEPEEAPPRYDAASLTYEPDQERRDKFLSRFSRWAKKGG